MTPGVGTWIGGVFGGFIGGNAASAGSKKIMDLIAEDDAITMLRLVQNAICDLSQDFMLNKNEIEKEVIPFIHDKINMKWLQKMYRSGHAQDSPQEAQEQYAYNQLEPLFYDILKKRKTAKIPFFKTRLAIFKNKAKLIKELLKIKFKKIVRKIVSYRINNEYQKKGVYFQNK